MSKRKYPYGTPSRDWSEPGDFYVDDKWMCYYTDTGSGQSEKFTVKKQDRTSEQFQSNPHDALRVMIASHQSDRKR